MRFHRVVIIVLALGLLLVPTLWASGLLDRDVQRLERARDSHAAEIERAFNIYSTNVERANERLSRIYGQTIAQYENRDDAETAKRLRDELESLTSRSMMMPFPEEDGAADEPATPSHVKLIEAIGPVLFNTAGQRAPSSRLAEYDYVVLYFTASWCMPCHRFTPKLVEFYNNHSRMGKWQLIVVSGDRTEDAFLKYMNDANMPWAAVPFHRQEAMQAIHRGGYPRVIMLDREGNLLVRSGLAREDGEQRLFNEIRARLRESDMTNQ